MYACSVDRGALRVFLRGVFRDLAHEFINQPRDEFRFIARGAVAKGKIYRGSGLEDDASWVLRDHPQYRDALFVGKAMGRANAAERDAPPFGVFLHDTAQDVGDTGEPFPFDYWWRWFTDEDSELVGGLRKAMNSYYDWCARAAGNIHYSVSRSRYHRGQASLYFGSS